MRKSDAEEQIKYWQDGDFKVYRWKREFAPAEYITFRKVKKTLIEEESTFETEVSKSTYNLGKFNYEDFVKILEKEELVYEKDNTWSTDTTKMKTGGCTCGSWILRENTYLHDDKCPQYARRHK